MSNLLFIDTETSGLPGSINKSFKDLKNWPRIVQIAWILYDNYQILKKEASYIIKPENFEISKKAQKVHKITQQRAELEGICINEILPEFIDDLRNANILIGHNINFDLNVIKSELLRNSLYDDSLFDKEIHDTMIESTKYCRIPGKNGYKWPTQKELYKILFDKKIRGLHDALKDARVTAKCFYRLCRIHEIRCDDLRTVREIDGYDIDLFNKIKKLHKEATSEIEKKDRKRINYFKAPIVWRLERVLSSLTKDMSYQQRIEYVYANIDPIIKPEFSYFPPEANSSLYLGLIRQFKNNLLSSINSEKIDTFWKLAIISGAFIKEAFSKYHDAVGKFEMYYVNLYIFYLNYPNEEVIGMIDRYLLNNKKIIREDINYINKPGYKFLRSLHPLRLYPPLILILLVILAVIVYIVSRIF